MINKKTVAVALSGGIDSAVSAKLLMEQGYNVVGLTGKMSCTEDFEQVVANARKVADKLNIEHYVLDVSAKFEQDVIKYFENSYRSGLTPNPCIMCNKFIKWGILFDYAINNLGADFIATGHYANIKQVDGYNRLYPASDEYKDQLYFLFMLEQEKLAKTLFPLSGYKKEEVRELAEKYDLPPKSAKESQDICFIKPPMTTKKYLNSLFKPQKGDFVEIQSGKVLGKHEGFWQYTIGQRKGIGIAYAEPLYVVGIKPEDNIVYVGHKDCLYKKELLLNNVLWCYPQSRREFKALVKIRYNMTACGATIKPQGDSLLVIFDEPVSAITSGQACVLYDINDGHLLGGGII